jgi:hypothetical protein
MVVPALHVTRPTNDHSCATSNEKATIHVWMICCKHIRALILFHVKRETCVCGCLILVLELPIHVLSSIFRYNSISEENAYYFFRHKFIRFAPSILHKLWYICKIFCSPGFSVIFHSHSLRVYWQAALQLCILRIYQFLICFALISKNITCCVRDIFIHLNI